MCVGSDEIFRHIYNTGKKVGTTRLQKKEKKEIVKNNDNTDNNDVICL